MQCYRDQEVGSEQYDVLSQNAFSEECDICKNLLDIHVVK